MDTATPNENSPLIISTSVNMPSIDDPESVFIEKEILFKKWWSSFDLLKASKLHWVLLTTAFSTIFYYPFKLWICKQRFDFMTHIFDIHRLLLSIIILIGCYLKFGKF
jgi:hypothetical protein